MKAKEMVMNREEEEERSKNGEKDQRKWRSKYARG